MVLFYNDKFCYSHMKTFHITESISKCEQVQSITLTRYFFTNRNMGYFPIVFFHECKILRDFAIIRFRQNTQLRKYCMYFLRWKMIETRLTRSSHKMFLRRIIVDFLKKNPFTKFFGV